MVQQNQDSSHMIRNFSPQNKVYQSAKFHKGIHVKQSMIAAV
eukprot:CAMPEP_0194363776 /NCGR_PEP_ID=MMETSP0174-20130528/11633_1 /TAXON_ID=216777 /ORGANISM="Proboscia alata, Strain PI-D3" /LENGTH=41 /DNA_ID= /DNA_START= /DNA_END= /DNA_ORIENTATION=